MAIPGLGTHIDLGDGRSVKVRPAGPGDAKAVKELVDAVAGEPETPILHVPGAVSTRAMRSRLAEAGRSSECLSLLALLDARPVAYLALQPSRHAASPHVGQLGLVIAADCRECGLGGALLDGALAWAAQCGYAKVSLGVFSHNLRAIAFYERHGFETEGLRRQQYVRGGRYHDEVLMACPLEGRR